MRLIDLLRMSCGSLKRRKLRTFLTVLGVVIGTSSIVVMVSLGLGLQKSVYEQVEQSGGATILQVSGQGGSNGMMMGDMSSDKEQSDKHITDDTVEQLKKLEHVDMAEPVLSVSAAVTQGRYEAMIEIKGMTPNALERLQIPLKEGTLPKANGAGLELVVGNMIPSWFYDKGTGQGFWETGVLPDLDFVKKSTFVVFDTENYSNGQPPSPSPDGTGTDGSATKKAAKKHVARASGLVEGDENTYNSSSYEVYCDIGTMKNLLKKEFVGRAIPGQPTRKNGKPYPYLTYSYIQVQADEMDNVKALSEQISALGYNVQSNMEFIESMEKQLFLIQAVLGGIGAISLLVAAIGIANTMMMSIYERTKEIGVIKVLGCGLKNIKQMFLMEAGFIGFFGGLIGNIISILISVGMNYLAKNAGAEMGMSGGISFIPPWLVLASLVFAIFVGMAAGYFPALRAMRLSPLAAIRND